MALAQPSKRKIVPQKKVEMTKPTEEVVKFKCTCCGTEYKTQNQKFFRNYSPMFVANNGYNTVCQVCMARDYESYLGVYGVVQQAIKRMCEKYDYYYDREIAEAVSNISDTKLAFGRYVSKLILAGHKERTYDSTLDEDFAHAKIMNATDAQLTQTEVSDELDNEANLKELAAKWGYGYTLEQYSWLEAEYIDWITRNECKSKSQEGIFAMLCQAKLDMLEARRNSADPKTIDTLTKSYLSLLDSAKLQPKQEGITQNDGIASMGEWIKMIENKEPVAEPAPEWEDVDRIKKLVQIIVGGLAKMMGVKNDYVEDYQAMLDEYTVEVSDDDYSDEEYEEEYDEELVEESEENFEEYEEYDE